MIFLLEKGFSTISMQNRVFQRAIGNLITASKNSYHLILMNPSEISILQEGDTFSKEDKLELNEIKNLSRQIINMIENSNDYISISHFHGICFSPNGSNDLDLEIFDENFYLQESVLLCEHIIDCDFYQHLLNCIFSKHPFGKQLYLRFSSGHGGGGAINAPYEKYIEEKRIVFCVADSDKSHLNSPIGSTCRSLPLTKPTKFSKAVITASRELENLLPVVLIEKVVQEKELFFEMLLDAEKHDYREFSLFSDIKNGITKRALRSFPSVFKELVEHSHFKLCQHQCKNNPCRRDEETQGKEREKRLEECKVNCSVTKGLGPNVLALVNKELDRMLTGKKDSEIYSLLSEMYHDETWKILENLILHAFPYGVAKKKSHFI